MKFRKGQEGRKSLGTTDLSIVVENDSQDGKFIFQ